MAFGIKRHELAEWKEKIRKGEIAFLTHYWIDDRFPGCNTVTKAGCRDIEKLAEWGRKYGLSPEWIDNRKPDYPHFDLFGMKQEEVLKEEGIKNYLGKK
ncbi:hypothetical protein J7E38_17830 [Bacillus sp. ISL-35]|uniref:hypothetical protein n=1 Tax=Bacillus sp. ISL-35 TaxID=2819122 RepID=UPI001BE81086|nr:hypothetical protein [Bacillus sp. ISL-35]MBT2680854.1 hypothetical protein [Bacillus sp. ISL-35]MBT2705170.1 hypothetical protein [Chryseobacterium sp. ISL-80]